MRFYVGLLVLPWLEEVDAPEYEREPIVFAGSQQLMFNRDRIWFPPASTHWGEVAGFVILACRDDALEDFIVDGPLTQTRQVDPWDQPSFCPRDISMCGPGAKKLSKLINQQEGESAK